MEIMMSEELLATKSGVVIFSIKAGPEMKMPSDTPAYSIGTDLRDDYQDRVILSSDEAAIAALVILRAEFARRGMGLSSAPLHTVGRLLGIDLENIPWRA